MGLLIAQGWCLIDQVSLSNFITKSKSFVLKRKGHTPRFLERREYVLDIVCINFQFSKWKEDGIELKRKALVLRRVIKDYLPLLAASNFCQGRIWWISRRIMHLWDLESALKDRSAVIDGKKHTHTWLTTIIFHSQNEYDNSQFVDGFWPPLFIFTKNEGSFTCLSAFSLLLDHNRFFSNSVQYQYWHLQYN